MEWREKKKYREKIEQHAWARDMWIKKNMIFVVDGRETKNDLPQRETHKQQMLKFKKPNTKCQKSIGLQ